MDQPSFGNVGKIALMFIYFSFSFLSLSFPPPPPAKLPSTPFQFPYFTSLPILLSYSTLSTNTPSEHPTVAHMDTLVGILNIHPGLKYGLAVLGYMALVRSLRYRRINALLAKYPDPTLPLRNLDIARECCSTINDFEFPYLNVTSLEFALFKTFAIPSISKVLVATKELSNHCLKRTDDTVFILLEMTELHSRIALRSINEGKFDSEAAENDHKRFQTSLERLNFIHSHYKIAQEEYLYTLALFILEPPSFIGRFEWRPLTLLERNVSMKSFRSQVG